MKALLTVSLFLMASVAVADCSKQALTIAKGIAGTLAGSQVIALKTTNTARPGSYYTVIQNASTTLRYYIELDGQVCVVKSVSLDEGE